MPSPGQCLCIFDVDRTLTGKQGKIRECPGNQLLRGIWDGAYEQGDLTLSELGQGVCHTFCGGCHLGIVSHGTAGSEPMKQKLLDILTCDVGGRLPNRWSSPGAISSPLVLSCADKPPCVRGVLDWYATQGVHVQDQDVHFFDDREDNALAVAAAGFTARQVSCGSRDGEVGYCGGRLAEVSAEPRPAC